MRQEPTSASFQLPDVGVPPLGLEASWRDATFSVRNDTKNIINPAGPKMAVYADALALSKTSTPDHEIWTTDYKPGVKAPRAGIYRCKECPVEIGVASGHSPPPTDHHSHQSGQPIRWNLIVRTAKP